jgi:dephospho-CoA kinase
LLDKPYLREMADFVLLITAPIEVRIARVMARDGLSREAVEKRMANQINDDERRKMADYILETNDRDAIIPQLLSIIQKWQQI